MSNRKKKKPFEGRPMEFPIGPLWIDDWKKHITDEPGVFKVTADEIIGWVEELEKAAQEMGRAVSFAAGVALMSIDRADDAADAALFETIGAAQDGAQTVEDVASDLRNCLPEEYQLKIAGHYR